ncbi:hypothetical protein A0J61_09651 [Choanephora cucurbitarum]|uniref:Uncharacterized protein n=1 Tax=Choanephora cucurbitarum TaxID=101091 RepID=A0A1C7MZL4_9FUNG|nr:hypothetical protein A0J61_09651 [Choanephora cucurbitarum]
MYVPSTAPSQKHQAPPINNLSHQEENSTVNKKKEQAINAQEKQDNVISDKCKKQPKTEVKTHVNNHFFPSPTYSCVSTSNSLDDKPDSRLDLISPETTPNHSEDEEEEEGAEKKDNNWYSPFSTGLDLDILPKLNLMDPLCQYKIDFKYNINIPLQHHYYHSHHHSHPYFRSSLHSAQNVSCIKVLENHPFISSKDSHSTHHQHVFGPVGDRKKQ